MGEEIITSRHPAVGRVVHPRSSGGAGAGGDGGPYPVEVESATPQLAGAVADIDADRLEGNAPEAELNARERAAAGHVAPDTVDLLEARVRAADNAAAAAGTRPETTAESAPRERPTPPRPRGGAK